VLQKVITLKKWRKGWGAIPYTCNVSYLEDGDKRIMVGGTSRKKVRPYLK
jgi:hypothetical protein